jgi:hypothetical protein
MLEGVALYAGFLLKESDMITLHLKDREQTEYKPIEIPGNYPPTEWNVPYTEPLNPCVLSTSPPLNPDPINMRKYKLKHFFPQYPEHGEDVHAYYEEEF